MQLKLLKSLSYKKGMQKCLVFSACLLLAGAIFLCLYYAYMDLPIAGTLSLIKDFQKENSANITIPAASSMAFMLKLKNTNKPINTNEFKVIVKNLQTNEEIAITGNSFNKDNRDIWFSCPNKIISSLKKGESVSLHTTWSMQGYTNQQFSIFCL